METYGGTVVFGIILMAVCLVGGGFMLGVAASRSRDAELHTGARCVEICAPLKVTKMTPDAQTRWCVCGEPEKP